MQMECIHKMLMECIQKMLMECIQKMQMECIHKTQMECIHKMQMECIYKMQMEQGHTYIKISSTCKTAQACTYRHSFPPRDSGGQTWRHTCCRQSSVWSAVDAGSDRWCRTGGGAGSQTQQAPEYPAHKESTLSQSLTQPLMFINMYMTLSQSLTQPIMFINMYMFCICFVCNYVAQTHMP